MSPCPWLAHLSKGQRLPHTLPSTLINGSVTSLLPFFTHFPYNSQSDLWENVNHIRELPCTLNKTRKRFLGQTSHPLLLLLPFSILYSLSFMKHSQKRLGNMREFSGSLTSRKHCAKTPGGRCHRLTQMVYLSHTCLVRF